jgi:hypothetical protein
MVVTLSEQGMLVAVTVAAHIPAGVDRRRCYGRGTPLVAAAITLASGAV